MLRGSSREAPEACSFVSSLNVTLDLNGRMVNLGSACRNFRTPDFGIFDSPLFFDDEEGGDRETIGETPLKSLEMLALLAFLEEDASTPSLEENIPNVGSNGMRRGGVSCGVEKDPCPDRGGVAGNIGEVILVFAKSTESNRSLCLKYKPNNL